MKYVVGILFILLGFAIVVKTEFFYGLTGAMDWPEQHLGPGGTRLFLKLIGVALFFIALLLMTGGLGDFGRAVLTPTVPAQ